MAENLFNTDIHEHVSNRYAEIAHSGGSSCCCGGNKAVSENGQMIGYTPDQLALLPEGANLGLGCGNPTSLTLIEPGMTVVDLGSGAGIDCFLASAKVGHEGKVIGVDMTDAMLEKARGYAAEKKYENIEFRKGQIESLPIDDASVDLVISNCVINLSPDKGKVFDEIARVLKPGGRAAISDIVLLKPLPDQIRHDLEAYIGCIACAELVSDYLAFALLSNLHISSAVRKCYDVVQVLGCSPEAGKLLSNMPADFNGNDHVASLEAVFVKGQ